LSKLYTETKKQQDNAPSVCFITLKNIHTRTHTSIQQLLRLCFETVHTTSKSSLVSKTNDDISLSSSPSQSESTHKATKDSLSKQHQRDSTKTSKKKNEKHKNENENKNTSAIENSRLKANGSHTDDSKKQLKPYPTSIPAQRKYVSLKRISLNTKMSGFLFNELKERKFEIRVLPETLWLVCGMPNVGKSTLINKLVGRYCAGMLNTHTNTHTHTHTHTHKPRLHC
jgi:ATPase subunit of ABC transporter with duplicated ATPase domains